MPFDQFDKSPVESTYAEKNANVHRNSRGQIRSQRGVNLASHARSSNFPLHRKTYHHQNGQYYLIFITVLQCLKKNLIINAAKSPFTTLYLQDSHFIRETGQSHIRGPR